MTRAELTPADLGAGDIGYAVEIRVQPKNGHPIIFGDYDHGLSKHVGILEEFIYGHRHGDSADMSFSYRMRGWQQRQTVYLSNHQVRIVVLR